MESLDPQKEIRHEIEDYPYSEERHKKSLNFVKKGIESFLKIELTASEVIKLSHIVTDTFRKERKQFEDLKNSSYHARNYAVISSQDEALRQGLYELYGVTLEEISKLFPSSEDEKENERNKELKRKYFRRKQAELYN